MKRTTMLRPLAAALLLAGTVPSPAVELRPAGVLVQAGAGGEGTKMAGVGLFWDWDFERLRPRAELTAHTELMVNRWHAHATGGGNLGLTQYVLLPTLRMRLDRGASPWFFELGVGASWMDHDFATPDRRFSTRWNFYDVLGAGHTFGGPAGKHELGVRWNHVSNGGLRKPNPGQDFLQLRYAVRF